jgi:hypothetical protein
MEHGINNLKNEKIQKIVSIGSSYHRGIIRYMCPVYKYLSFLSLPYIFASHRLLSKERKGGQ